MGYSQEDYMVECGLLRALRKLGFITIYQWENLVWKAWSKVKV